MANLIALVANDGVNFRPHMIHAIRHPGESMKTDAVTPEVLHQIEGPQQFWGDLKSALVDVIEDGTAGTAKIPGVRWGGKTGSAEEKKGAKTHSWFVGFAPYDHPKIAICVFVEQGGHGGEVAAPIAKRVVQRYLASKEAKAASNSVTAPDTSVDLVPSPNNR